jgi:hypothetical protein
MRKAMLGILLLLATTYVWAQTPASPATTSLTTVTTQTIASPNTVTPAIAMARRHGPRIAVGKLPNQAASGIQVFTSTNWSGYAVVGQDFTQATGTWTVPAVDCSTDPKSSASFWVGIDGWDNDTVEQTGTDSDCDGTHPNYYAWFEFAPKQGVTITSVPVSPGDEMSAEVDYDGSQFVITTTNTTTGASFNTTAAFPKAKRTSAEWIAEANGYLLSDFGTVHFGPDFTRIGANSATDSSTSGVISAFGKDTQASVIVNSKNEDLAVPSFLSVDGTSFTVDWWAKE